MISGKATKVGEEAELYQKVNGVETKVLGFDPLTGAPKDVSGQVLAKQQNTLDVQAGLGYYIQDTQYIGFPLTYAWSPGYSDYTVLAVARQASANTGRTILFRVGSASVVLEMGINTSQQAFVTDYNGAATTKNSTGTVAVGKTAVVCAQRSTAGTAHKLFINGILDSSTTGDTARDLTLTPTEVNFGGYVSSGLSLLGNLYRSLYFNYAISADKVARYSAGAKLDYDDIGGSMVNTATNGGYSDTTDWTNPTSGLAQYWTALNLNGKSIVTGSGFTGNAQRAAYSSTSSDVIIYPPGSYTLGKRYQITFKYRSNQTLKIACNTFGSPLVTFTANTGNAISASCVVTMDATGNIGFGWSGAVASDYMEIDEVRIIQLGAVLDLEPESATSSVWHDESGNQLDGTVTGAQLVNLPHFANTDYGPAAVKQELIDNSADKPSYYVPTGTNRITTTSCPITGDASHSIIVTYKADSVVSVPRRILTMGVWATNQISGLSLGSDGKACFGIDNPSPVKTVTTPSPVTLGWHTYALSYDQAQLSGYLDGIRVGTLAVTSINIGSSTVCVGNEFAGFTQPCLGQVSRSVIFNYALSEDKIRRYSAGAKLDYEDVGGSMTELVTNTNFESDTIGSGPSWWSCASSAVRAAPGTGHGTKSVQITLGDGIYRSFLTVGKRYVISYWVYGTAGDQVYDNANTGPETVYVIKQSNTWEKATLAFTAVNAILVIAPKPGSVSMPYIDDISVVRAGAVLDLEPENITDTMWVDASPNGLHGTVSGALANRFVPSYSSRNYIINGAFDFWQRGTSFVTGGAASLYSADRWWFYNSTADANALASQVLSTLDQGMKTALSMKALNTASRQMTIQQSMEDSLVIPLQGKTMTVSLKAMAVTAQPTNGWRLQVTYDTTANMSNPGVGVLSVPITPAIGSWGRISATFVVPSNAKSLAVSITTIGNVVNNAEIRIGEFMLNEGPVAAPFERAGGSIGGELDLCERYFQNFYSTLVAGIYPSVRAELVNSTSVYFNYFLRTKMRPTATPSLYSNSPVEGSDFTVANLAGTGQTGFTLSGTATMGEATVRLRFDKTSHGLTDASCLLYTNKIGVSAEL